MSTTPHLGLPLLAAAQAQKHVTHNEALLGLDAVVQLAVLDRDRATPPASPAEGDRHIVADAGTGAWAGRGGQVAAWRDGAWRFYAPGRGWLAYVVGEGALLGWDGAAWIDAIRTISAFQNLTRLGLGTTADAVNPFAAKLNDALWTARAAAEGGSGDLRYKLNKESAARTLSLLFQSGYSGRAEFGLVGDDDFLVKVSPDGIAWRDAIRIDRATGAVSFPSSGGAAGADGLDLTVSLLALQVADLANTTQFLGKAGNRVADSFDTLAQVDVAGATNLDTSAPGLLRPSPLTTTEGSATPSGSLDASAFTILDRSFAVDNGKRVVRIGAYSSTARSLTVKLARRNSAGSYDIVASEGFAHPGGGWADKTLAMPFDVPASGDYHAGLHYAAGVIETNAGVPRAYVPGDASGAGVAFTENAAACTGVRVAYAGGPANMTVRSVAFAAAAVPGTAKAVARLREVDAAAPGVDYAVEASRDGGATWTALALAERFDQPGAIKVVESDETSLAAQPSGTSMRWRLRTLTNKMIELHDLYFYWD